MKMDQKTYLDIKAAVDKKISERPWVWENYKANGWSAEKFRWDALFACGISTSFLYKQGLNDARIDTALRKITKNHTL